MSIVYIGNLDVSVNQEALEKRLAEFGNVTAIDFKTMKNPAFAFATFENESDADAAISQLNDTEFEGARIRVEKPRSRERRDRSDRPRGYKIEINRIERMDWRELKDAMRKYGEVTYTNIDNRTNNGYVEFTSESDALAAQKALDGNRLEDSTVSVRVLGGGGGGGGGYRGGYDRRDRSPRRREDRRDRYERDDRRRDRDDRYSHRGDDYRGAYRGGGGYDRYGDRERRDDRGYGRDERRYETDYRSYRRDDRGTYDDRGGSRDREYRRDEGRDREDRAPRDDRY